MSSENFKKCLDIILANEGGNVDIVNDPGGKTNQGITQATFAAYLKAQGESVRDVYTMLDEERDAIYRREYWDRIRGDELPLGIAMLAMDTAVNQGCVRAIKCLQQSAKVKPDGHLGPITLAAIKAADQKALMAEFASQRAYHYMTLDSIDDTFGLGWARRLFRTFTAALEAT